MALITEVRSWQWRDAWVHLLKCAWRRRWRTWHLCPFAAALRADVARPATRLGKPLSQHRRLQCLASGISAWHSKGWQRGDRGPPRITAVRHTEGARCVGSVVHTRIAVPRGAMLPRPVGVGSQRAVRPRPLWARWLPFTVGCCCFLIIALLSVNALRLVWRPGPASVPPADDTLTDCEGKLKAAQGDLEKARQAATQATTQLRAAELDKEVRRRGAA